MKSFSISIVILAFVFSASCNPRHEGQDQVDKKTTAFQISQQEELRHKIRFTLFIPDQLPELNAKTHGTFEPCAGVIAERISFSTLYNLDVPGILYLTNPRPTGKIPALVIVNGHGGDKYLWHSYYAGMIYAKGGAAVLTYDQIGEGERNINHKSGTRAHDVYQDPPEMGRRMRGLMMADVMQSGSYLSERNEMDKDRIAALGHSMGSFVLSLAGAVDTRINSVVLTGGGNLDGPDGYWDNSKPMCQGIPYQWMLHTLVNRQRKISITLIQVIQTSYIQAAQWLLGRESQ